MTGQAPALTVVVPTFRGGGRVPGAVASVLDQDRAARVEVVVVDDGSDDDTPERLRALAATDPRVRVLTRPNGGISAARNAGLAAAQGWLVTFLDDDDRLLDGYVDAVVGASRPGSPSERAVAVCVGARLVDAATGEVIETRRPRDLGPAFGGMIGVFAAGTLVAPRSLLARVGGYREGLTCSHQTELLLRLAACVESGTLEIVAIDEALIEIRRRAPEARPENAPAKLLAGAAEILAVHGPRLRTDPRLFADFHAVAGVAAVRAGDGPRCRRHLAAALRAGRAPRDLARWAAGVGPWRRAVWR